MAVLDRNIVSPLLLAVLSCIACVGCSAPWVAGPKLVSSKLFDRTGYDLGPRPSECGPSVPPGVEWADGLTEDEAVALGLWNNPGYLELLADLGISRADVIAANQLANPDVATFFPLSAKQWELTLLVPLDVVLLRPHRVAAAQLESHRVAERLVQDGLNVVRDIRLAFADLVRTKQSLRFAESGLNLRQQISQIAESRLEAGALSQIDVATTRLDVMFGKQEVTRLTGEMRVAHERLRYLLGLAMTNVCLEPIASPELEMVIDCEQLVAEAVASRPDLRAVRFAVDSANVREKLAFWDYFNIRGALPDINSKGRKDFEAGPGLALELPILNQNQGAKARINAEIERFRRQYANLRDLAATEVRQAVAQLWQAQSELRIWSEEVIPEAERTVANAERALKEDGISLLMVLENTRALLTAQQREAEATANVNRAFAELERSVGRHLQPDMLGQEVPVSPRLPELLPAPAEDIEP